jgi:NADPH2:quinone reductase
MSALPASMMCVEIKKPGGPEALVPTTRPVPQPKAGELLIKVAATGVNRPDLAQRAGSYPPPAGASDLPGLEAAGTVAALGDDVTDWKVGDPVCALTPGGSYAEYCTAPAPQCLPPPNGFDMLQAAALPENYFTVWHNLFERGQLKAGEQVLIHGGASGIGTTAIQLARAFGATAIATAGSPEKCAACLRLGAVLAIDYHTDDFVTAVHAHTAGEGVDLVFDIIGGDYLPRNLECLRLNGRVIQIGLIGGPKATVDLRAILQKRLTLTGSTLRARAPAEKGAIARELERQVWPLLDRGEVGPIVHAEFPLERAADAHRELESGRVIGKVVLVVQ